MNKKVFLHIIGAVFFFIPLVLLSGCVEEDMSECYDGVFVVLRIDPQTTGAEQAKADARDAVIYVFDSQGKFLERRETQLDKEELLYYPDAGQLSVVGWVNMVSGIYSVTPFNVNTDRGDGRVMLSSFERATTYNNIPTDLFYGDVVMLNESNTVAIEKKEILASRKDGSMTITVRGLQDYAGKYDNNYYIVVGPMYRGIDFFGNYISCDAMLTPTSAFNSSGEFTVPIFNMLPTGNDRLKISIYHGESGLVYETDVDKDNRPITVIPDRTENILIDFSGGLSISVQRTDWGVSYPWKSFN